MTPKINDTVLFKGSLKEGKILAIEPITLLFFTVDYRLVVQVVKDDGGVQNIEVDASRVFLKGVNPYENRNVNTPA